MSVALGVLSLLIPSVPTTDPWGWIVWGRQVVHLRLDTVAGPPSWKPLPVLATAPLSLLGSAAPAAWLVVARTGGALALLFAYRVAARSAGWAAGVVAALALVLSANWLRLLAHGYSEALAVALLLAAVECHVLRRRGLAVALGVLVSLARPEAWPLAALYGVVLVAGEQRRWWPIAASLALSPLLWVLPDWWGSGDPLHAERVARVNLTGAGTDPGLRLLHTGWGLLSAPVWVLALASIGLAAHRREWTVLVLGLTATSWIGVEAVATTLGYPGATRFLVLPAALACVLAGIGGAWLAQTAPRPARPLLAAGLIAAALPFLVSPAAKLSRAAQASVTRARFQQDLRRSIERAGGAAALHARGAPLIPAGLWWNAGALAWDLRVPLEGIHKIPEAGLADLRGVRAPALVFAPVGGTPPDDPAWRSTPRIGRCGLTVRVLARSGLWQILAIARAPARPGAAWRCPPRPPARRIRRQPLSTTALRSYFSDGRDDLASSSSRRSGGTRMPRGRR